MELSIFTSVYILIRISEQDYFDDFMNSVYNKLKLSYTNLLYRFKFRRKRISPLLTLLEENKHNNIRLLYPSISHRKLMKELSKEILNNNVIKIYRPITPTTNIIDEADKLLATEPLSSFRKYSMEEEENNEEEYQTDLEEWEIC